MTRKALMLVIFIPSAAITCWMGMMLVHESGHMLAAIVSGGTVQRLVFGPLEFSRTDISPNPHPLVVAWAGPVGGALFPLALSRGLRIARIRSYLAHFFSAFCLLANGAYIGAGSFDRVGDAGDLLKYGCPPWMLWLFGAAAVAGSMLQFHRLGPRLGMTTLVKPADALLAAGLATLLLIVSGIVN
jgi:hypothetical protein